MRAGTVWKIHCGKDSWSNRVFKVKDYILPEKTIWLNPEEVSLVILPCELRQFGESRLWPPEDYELAGEILVPRMVVVKDIPEGCWAEEDFIKCIEEVGNTTNATAYCVLANMKANRGGDLDMSSWLEVELSIGF